MSRSWIAIVALLAFGLISKPVWSGQVTAFALDGSKVEGEIAGCADSKVTIETTSGTVSLAFATLDRIEITNASKTRPISTTEGGGVATLVDGSSIVCQGFVGRDDRWTASSSSGMKVEFPKGSVESLRIGTPSASLNREWLDAAKELRTSDEMVISRRSDAIDRASGMIVGVTPEIVEFSFDGQILQAPRSKLLGLLWYRSQEKRVEPAIQIKMLDGSRWEASSISLFEQGTNSQAGLRWSTSSGVETQSPWSDIQEVNFSAANVVWLALQQPLSTKTFQRTLLKQSIPGRDALLEPRFVSANGSDDAKFQDLNFMGPGEIAFRIPSGFQRFVAKVRRSEKARFATSVRCEVWVGDEVAWKATLAPDQVEAVVDIPVLPDQRLKLLVACDSDLLLGTQLSWQQPRLTR